MTDVQYMLAFEEYYDHPEEKTYDVINESCRFVDALIVASMKLQTAANPWDNADDFDQCLADCNDILELTEIEKTSSDKIKELLDHYIRSSNAYFKIAEDLLKATKERDEKVDTKTAD